MSSERQELVRILRLLSANDIPDEQQLEGQDNLKVLRSILEIVRKSDECLARGDDSLAFSHETRAKFNLAQADRLWHLLEKFNEQLRQDYTCRRQMLLRRLDCTVESFKWKGSHGASKAKTADSDGERPARELRGKAKTMNDKIHERYEEARKTMSEEPQVSVANLLALRESDCDKLLNSVISSKSTDCKIAYGDGRNSSRSAQASEPHGELVNLKQVMIPQVPDRGGRTDEIRPPPKETLGSQHGRGGGHHSRHRSGRSRR